MSDWVGSWFGGPAPKRSTRPRSSSSPTRVGSVSSKSYNDRRGSPARAPSTTSKSYIVRQGSPSRSEPKYAFVRTRSPRRPSPTRSTNRGFSPARSEASTSKGFFTRPGQGSSSYYKRSPRQGYIARLVDIIRRLIRDLIRYARENPMKMFMLVVMPLISGGLLTGLLAKLGLRLPAGIAAMMQKGAGAAGGGGLGSLAGGLAGGVTGGASKGALEQAIGIAKMFM